MKINKKYERVVFSFLMSFCMSVATSFVRIFSQSGFNDDFFVQLLNGMISSFVVTFPTALIAVPMISKFVGNMIDNSVKE